MQSTALHVQSASFRFDGAAAAVYENLSFTLGAGEWTCLLGASGCGKSTLLRQLAGLIDTADSSELVLEGSDADSLSGQVAWMGQQDLLYPWLKVIDNVCVGEKITQGRVSKATREQGMVLLASFGLADVANQRPEQLSGGMRQRVALARTLMQDKPVVLMDEPFSALDAVNRHKLQSLAVEKLSARTVLLVTHDPQEALRLGQQILLFKGIPSQLQSLEVPAGEPPRNVADLGAYQAQLLSDLGVVV